MSDKKEEVQNKLLETMGSPPILYEVNLRKISDPVQDSDKLDFLKEPKPKEPPKNVKIEDVEVDIFRVYSSLSPKKQQGAKQ